MNGDHTLWTKMTFVDGYRATWKNMKNCNKRSDGGQEQKLNRSWWQCDLWFLSDLTAERTDTFASIIKRSRSREA